MEVVSSSTNFIKTTISTSNTTNMNPQLKNELVRLSDCFDKKLNELLDIRDELKKVISEIA